MPTPIPFQPGAHPSAVIDPGAVVHPSAAIGPYAVVGPGVVIGPRTVLHNHACVIGPTTIGEDNVIYPFAVVGAEPQDLKYHGETTELVIGDRNRIREHVTIHRGTEAGGSKTVIGSDCLIMVGAHIAHDCVVEDQAVIANGVMLGGHCLIEFGATIAGGAGIHHFTTVGQLAFVGGLARITKDVPPYLVVEGSPAEPRKVNTTALIRRGWADAEIDALRAAYKALYRGDEPMAVAIARLRADTANATAAVTRLCDCLERTQLGVHGRYRETFRSAAAPRR
ncbi:MAG: acyl-ACP--UDP-N-acetylglucosamine O-acyltransferase [Planctomycetota bacterium]|nr:MAG: acyl-ACP--UDP-N-acetylglucosamine O-acyltransferase [Planctomycetota bacterium]